MPEVPVAHDNEPVADDQSVTLEIHDSTLETQED